MQAHIHKALDKLSPRERTVFTLRHYQDLPLREIAEMKKPDLNANDIEAGIKIVAGTARSMGVTVKEA